MILPISTIFALITAKATDRTAPEPLGHEAIPIMGWEPALHAAQFPADHAVVRYPQVDWSISLVFMAIAGASLAIIGAIYIILKS